MTRELLDETALSRSAVVANCRMNRERRLTGPGGYVWELGFDLVSFLEWRTRTQGRARWLDLCCGEGRALVEAAEHFSARGMSVDILGIDLVDAFAPAPALPGLERRTAQLPGDFSPPDSVDLITCVHGLHYVGDKLGMIQRMASWLAEDGKLVAHIDLRNLILDGASAQRRVPRMLRDAGLSYDRQLIRAEGRRSVRLPVVYLGADDQVGPNYTGQPAVAGVYRLLR